MKLINGSIVALFTLFTSLCFSKPFVEEHHVMIVQPGVDMVMGSYMFGVRNDGTEAEMLKVPMLFPDEMVDFQVEGDLDPADLKLGDNGKVYLEKMMKPGMNLIEVSFLANAKFGTSELTFNPEMEIGKLSMLFGKNSGLAIEGGNLLPSDPGAMGEQFVAYTSQSVITQGKEFKLSVSGVPQGRYGLWVLGYVFAGVLTILAIVFTLHNRREVQATLS